MKISRGDVITNIVIALPVTMEHLQQQNLVPPPINPLLDRILLHGDHSGDESNHLSNMDRYSK